MIISASTVRAELVHYTSSYNKYMQQKAKLRKKYSKIRQEKYYDINKIFFFSFVKIN